MCPSSAVETVKERFLFASLSSPFTVTVVFALPTSSFNCATLTASVSFSPLATLIILLPPLSRPVFVKDTVLSPFSIVIPDVLTVVALSPSRYTVSPAVVEVVTSPSFTTVPVFVTNVPVVWSPTDNPVVLRTVSPVVTLPASTFVVVPSAFVNSALVKPFNSFANFTSTVEPFAFTPILLSDNLSLSAPPVILKAIPPCLFKACVSVLDALSAPNWIVLFATAFAASDTVFN